MWEALLDALMKVRTRMPLYSRKSYNRFILKENSFPAQQEVIWQWVSKCWGGIEMRGRLQHCTKPQRPQQPLNAEPSWSGPSSVTLPSTTLRCHPAPGRDQASVSHLCRLASHWDALECCSKHPPVNVVVPKQAMGTCLASTTAPSL